MGNRQSPCAEKHGEDFAKCFVGNRSRSTYAAQESQGNPEWEPVLGSYYDFLIGSNAGAYDPDIGLFRISESDRFIQDSANGRVDLRSVKGWADGEQDIVNGYFKGMRVENGNLEIRILDNVIDGRAHLGTKENFNWHMLNNYMTTYYRIEKVCPGLFQKVWPEFYHSYNTRIGKQQVDAWLAENPGTPQSCVDALKSNYTDYSQRRYQLLNEPNPFSNDWSFQDSLDCGRSRDCYVPMNFGIFDAQTSISGFNFRGHPGRVYRNDPSLETMYLRKTLRESDFTNNWYGNPLWSRYDRNQALSRALGKDVATGQEFYLKWAQDYVDQGIVTPGQTAVDYFDPEKSAGIASKITDPNFSGKLPHAPTYMLGNEPWHDTTQSDDDYGYTNTCDNQGALEKMLPVIAALVLGGGAALIVPGSLAKLSAGATGATAGYFLVDGIYGWQAVQQLFGTVSPSTSKNVAAKAISIGVPVTAAVMLVEMDVLPAQLTSTYGQIGFIGASAALGIVLIYPMVLPVLGFGGSAFTVLTAPLAAIEYGLTILITGCYKHLAIAPNSCKCEVANTKPKIITAIADEMLGTTGSQNGLRRQCLRAAMTTGSWGTDLVRIGTCNLNNGEMSGPEACLPAGSWVYEAYNKPTQLAKSMFGEIQHCMDANNLSMLPARPQDADCVAKYGIYARNDGSGKCMDYRAPQGVQEAGAYNFTDISSNESCSIL